MGYVLKRLASLAERLWILAVLRLLPRAFRDQNVSLAGLGERHHLLYDSHQLQQLLIASNFVAIQRCTAATSR